MSCTRSSLWPDSPLKGNDHDTYGILEATCVHVIQPTMFDESETMMIFERMLTCLWVGLLSITVACATQQGPSADDFSAEGSANWTQHGEELAQTADAAGAEYRRLQTVAALRTYEVAVRTYLDYGFARYRAIDASSTEFPSGFRRSLEHRTSELMDIADEYLKQGISDIVAVEIARAVVNEYNVGRMDHAQRRAEAMLDERRYQRNY